MSRRYALVVGISEYRAPLANLSKTASDARAIATLFKQDGTFEQVTSLIGNVTKEALEQAFQRLLLEQSVGSDALIYFTGHGIVADEGVFLATSDGEVELRGNQVVAQKYCFSLRKLNELIRQANLSSLVVFLDCCHSGRFLEEDPVQQALAAFRESKKDYFFITACRGFEDARARKSEAHSVFTGALLDALSPKRVGGDGQISGESVLDHLRQMLHGSGQEPIRLGYGRSLPIIFYPVQPPPSEANFKPENPYVGLAAFEREQAAYFYGRSQEVRELLARLDPLHSPPRRFLAVLGPSGCGKSSLVKAGLLPELKNDGLPGSQEWEIAAIRPGETPKAFLTTAIQTHPSNQPYVLFIDQFEELFTLCQQEDERREFLTLLKQEATSPQRQTRVVVAMRGDFLDRCAKYQESADLINQTQPTAFMVTPLTTEKLAARLEDVIVKPAAMHGVTFAPGLVSQIVSEVLGQPGAMPLLQYALTELWTFCIKDVNSEPRLTHEGYAAIGGVMGALERRADSLYAGFTNGDQALVRKLMLKLVQIGDAEEVTRRRATWEDLQESLPLAQVQRIVDRLVQERLIMADENMVDVAHEALLSEWALLKGWIEEDRDNIRTEARFKASFQEWVEKGRSDDYLLTGGRLSAVEEWTEKNQPNLPDRQFEFLKKSLERRGNEQQNQLDQERKLREEAEARAKAEEEKKLIEIEKALEAEAKAKAETDRAKEAEARNKTEKQKTRWFFTAMLLAVGVAVLAFVLNQQLKKREKDVIAALVAVPQQLLQNGRQLESLLASVKVSKRLKSIPGSAPPSFKELFRNFQEINRLEGHFGEVMNVNFSPSGEMIASSGRDNFVRIWTKDGELLRELKHNTKYGVWDAVFSHNGKFLVSADSSGIIRIWNIKTWTNRELRPKELKAGDYAPTVSLSSDDLLVSAAITNDDNSGSIVVWNTLNNKQVGKFQNIRPPGKFTRVRIFGMSFSPIQQIIAFGDENGWIRLWNFKSNQLAHSWIGHKKPIQRVSFSPNGKILATAGSDGLIKIWNPYNGELIRVLSGHQDQVYGIAFSPDGKTLSSSSKDESIKLWDLESGKLTKTLKGHSDSINGVVFSKDGKILASASDDGTVRLWLTSPNTIPSNANFDTLMVFGCQLLKNYLKNNGKIPASDKEICNSIQ